MDRTSRLATMVMLTVALLVPGASPALGADLTMAAAINKAGRERMLSQRIVKAYCQIGLDVMPEDSRRQLRDSVSLFERQLEELRAFAPSEPIRATVAELEGLWPDFRAKATGPVTSAGCEALSVRSDAVLAVAHRLTGQLQDVASTPTGRLVNISGRQRMLSQRLAKLYMVQAAQFDSSWLRDEMESARNEFSGALQALQAAPENTVAVDAELQSVARQWEWFQAALSQDSSRAQFGLVVADASESILVSLERVTRMYEEIAEQH